jgi:hypothetical protein
VTSPRRRSPFAHDIRWRRVALAVLVVAGAGGIAWLLAERSPGDPIRVLVASRLAGKGVPGQGRDPAALVATLPKGERDPGLVEVCGLGWVEKRVDADAIDPALLTGIPGIETALDAIVDRLRQSPDGFTRAAAIVLAMGVGSGGEEAVALREQLARQATTTDDPRLYALTFRLCARAPTNSSCALLSAAQWARLDAGNGEPWLFVLDDAAAHGDRAMVDEAIYRIGSAARFDDRYSALTAAVVAQAGASDADLMAARMLTMVLDGVAAAQSLPLQRFDACKGAELADANRRQVCDAVAATLAERSDSMLLASVGAGIGRGVGWGEERVIAPRALWLALLDSWSAVPDAKFGNSYSCGGIRAILARVGRMAEVGELQAARDWIAASGKSFESFAREASEESRRVAAAAASAASASRPGG